jgi:acetyl/propionyl-CoA carboxylase alpha subunit
MKFQVEVGGVARSVELRRQAEGWECRVDGRVRAADLVEVAPGVYSLLLEGHSFTVRVERAGGRYRVHTCGSDFSVSLENPRQWRGRAGGAVGRAGRQEIAAPMPGKVVRVLVAEEQKVEAGQGLVVVEAMKMQNEIPSPKSGRVERVLVREGDKVEHGAVLLVVA